MSFAFSAAAVTKITSGAPFAAALRAALKAGEANVAAGGGPFGAAIVRTADKQVVVVTANSVTRTNDPTAHAEVNAIREAGKVLNTFDLSGHTLVTSCYPCPMCAGAAMWARVDAVIYGASPQEAASIGFDDAAFYHELSLPDHKKAVPFLRAPDPPVEAEEENTGVDDNAKGTTPCPSPSDMQVVVSAAPSPIPSPAASTQPPSPADSDWALTKEERLAPFMAWQRKADKVKY